MNNIIKNIDCKNQYFLLYIILKNNIIYSFFRDNILLYIKKVYNSTYTDKYKFNT